MAENGNQIPEGAEPQQPKLMAADILADWDRGVVIIQEKAKGGLMLVSPLTFVIPLDAFMGAAYNLGLQQIQRRQQQAINELGRLQQTIRGPKPPKGP